MKWKCDAADSADACEQMRERMWEIMTVSMCYHRSVMLFMTF